MAQAATQRTTGATRIKGPMVVTMRGAGSAGHDPLTVGAGIDPALSLQVPTSQTANALQIEQPDGTVVGGMTVSRVSLTAANIAAMNGAPVAILAAPGAGKAILPLDITIIVKRTATAYTNGGAVSFQYHTTTSSVPHAGSMPASIVTTGGAGTVVHYLGPNTGSNGTPIPANEGIDITNASAAFATGTGTMVVLIRYCIITAS